MKKKDNRAVSTFQIQDLLPIGMTLVVLGIALAYGLLVMGEVQEDIELANDPSWTTASATVTAGGNATRDAIEGVAELPAKLPTIATVVVAAVIIGILVTYLAARFMK